MKRTGLWILICSCMLVLSGCTGKMEESDYTENETESESSSADNEKVISHSVAKFEISDEIFDKCYEEFWEIYTGEEIDAFLILEEENSFEMEMKVCPDNVGYKTDTEICYLSDITGHDEEIYFLVSNYDRDTGNIISTSVISYHYINEKTDTIIDYTGTNLYIIKIAFSKDSLYWIETDYNYDENDPSWAVKSMNLSTGVIREIDNSDSYGRTTMMPLMQAWNGRIVFFIGEEIEGQYYHQVRLYDAEQDVCKKIFQISNVIYADVKPYIGEKVIACAEYFDDGWYLLCYDLTTERISETKLSFFTKEGEFPYIFYVTDDQIIYCASTSALYVLDRRDGKLKLLDDCAPGAYRGALLDREFLYITGGSLWKYDLDSMEKTRYLKCEPGPDYMYSWKINGTEEAVYICFVDGDQQYYYLKYQKPE